MNTLSSLPPPAFADLALRGALPSAASAQTLGALDGSAGNDPLHVGSDAALRSIDDIEREFLAALCENRPA